MFRELSDVIIAFLWWWRQQHFIRLICHTTVEYDYISQQPIKGHSPTFFYTLTIKISAQILPLFASRGDGSRCDIILFVILWSQEAKLSNIFIRVFISFRLSVFCWPVISSHSVTVWFEKKRKEKVTLCIGDIMHLIKKNVVFLPSTAKKPTLRIRQGHQRSCLDMNWNF